MEGSTLRATLLTLAYADDTHGDRPWMDTTLNADARALLLKAMTEDEKFQMLHSYFGLGKDGGPLPEGAVGSAGFVPGVARLGIPSQQSADAGVGVTNPGGIRPGDFATAMPSGPSTASSWNREVAFAGGATMGREAWQQRFNILLSGSVNLQRDPRNGRNFEYAGEDPLLAGSMVGALIQGVQSQHVISSMKHFALNDMETRRNFHDVRIGEQAMHESDLLAFEIALEAGRPGVAMCSYNKINGTYGCENGYLMNQVLKQEWKFPGFVMSDWGGVHSGSKAALAGLDQQSAGEVFDAAVFFDEPLRLAVHGGVVPQARLNDMVARILRTMFLHGNFDNPPQHQKVDAEAGFAVAQRTVEEGSVLLRNEGNLLPLADSVKRIVIIGGHADKGVIGGGGSSMVGVTAKGTNAVPGVMPTTWPGPVIFHPSSPLESLRAAPGRDHRVCGRDQCRRCGQGRRAGRRGHRVRHPVGRRIGGPAGHAAAGQPGCPDLGSGQGQPEDRAGAGNQWPGAHAVAGAGAGDAAGLVPGHPRWRRHRRAADRPGQSVGSPAGDLGGG